MIPETTALLHTGRPGKPNTRVAIVVSRTHRFYPGLTLAVFMPHHVLFSSLIKVGIESAYCKWDEVEMMDELPLRELPFCHHLISFSSSGLSKGSLLTCKMHWCRDCPGLPETRVLVLTHSPNLHYSLDRVSPY